MASSSRAKHGRQNRRGEVQRVTSPEPDASLIDQLARERLGTQDLPPLDVDPALIERRVQERLQEIQEAAINRAVEEQLNAVLSGRLDLAPSMDGDVARGEAPNRAATMARVLDAVITNSPDLPDPGDSDPQDTCDSGPQDADDDGDGDDGDVPVLNNATVPFRGRDLTVRMPDIDQVTIIRRLETTFRNAAQMTNMDAEKAVKLMDRALRAVLSIMTEQDDREFIEDLILCGDAKIVDTLPILREAMAALQIVNQDAGNRATRRMAQRKSSGAARLVVTEE